MKWMTDFPNLTAPNDWVEPLKQPEIEKKLQHGLNSKSDVRNFREHGPFTRTRLSSKEILRSLDNSSRF